MAHTHTDGARTHTHTRFQYNNGTDETKMYAQLLNEDLHLTIFNLEPIVML